MYIPVENELELRLGNFPVLMWDSSLLPEGFFFFFKLDFYLIIYLIDSSLEVFLLGRGTFGLRRGLDWELRKECVSLTWTLPV